MQGVPLARNAGVLEVGADARLSDRVTFGLTYGGQYAGSEIGQSAWANLTVRF